MEFRIDFEGCEAIAVGRDTDEAGPGRTMTGVAGIASGFAAGTEIATTLGWRTVETLQPGDRVLTFDHGSQPVRAVQRGFLWRGAAPCPEPLWPLFVPEGVLGNSAPLSLMPEQSVLVESDMAEDLYGDPFVLLPARFLEGALGIHRVAPALGATVEVIVPLFDQPEIAFANGSALVFCPARGEGETVPLNRLGELQIVPDTGYGHPPAPAVARHLVETLPDQRPMRLLDPALLARQAA